MYCVPTSLQQIARARGWDGGQAGYCPSHAQHAFSSHRHPATAQALPARPFRTAPTAQPTLPASRTAAAAPQVPACPAACRSVPPGRRAVYLRCVRCCLHGPACSAAPGCSADSPCPSVPAPRLLPAPTQGLGVCAASLPALRHRRLRRCAARWLISDRSGRPAWQERGGKLLPGSGAVHMPDTFPCPCAECTQTRDNIPPCAAGKCCTLCSAGYALSSNGTCVPNAPVRRPRLPLNRFRM